MSAKPVSGRLTIRDIQAFRDAGEQIAMLTAYDHVTAGLLDQSGIDMILGGRQFGQCRAWL